MRLRPDRLPVGRSERGAARRLASTGAAAAGSAATATQRGGLAAAQGKGSKGRRNPFGTLLAAARALGPIVTGGHRSELFKATLAGQTAVFVHRHGMVSSANFQPDCTSLQCRRAMQRSPRTTQGGGSVSEG